MFQREMKIYDDQKLDQRSPPKGITGSALACIRTRLSDIAKQTTHTGLEVDEERKIHKTGKIGIYILMS